MRKKLQQFDEELQQCRSAFDEKLQQFRSEVQNELRTLVEENIKLQEENSKLRALCAELHEARGLLDFIKMQCNPDRPPQ